MLMPELDLDEQIAAYFTSALVDAVSDSNYKPYLAIKESFYVGDYVDLGQLAVESIFTKDNIPLIKRYLETLETQ